MFSRKTAKNERSTLDGIWWCPDAAAQIQEVSTDAGTVTFVETAGFGSTYQMRDRRRQAVPKLLDLASDRNVSAVADFVTKFGELIRSFDRWVTDGIALDGWEQMSQIDPRDLVDGWRLTDREIDLPPEFRGQIKFQEQSKSSSVVFSDFIIWCRANGFRSTACYAMATGQEYSRTRQLTHPAVPVAFYYWSAQCLAEMVEQLEQLAEGEIPRLSLLLQYWLRAQMNDTHLYLGGTRDKLVWFGYTAETLLAYLTVSAAFETTGYTGQMKHCIGCGKEFNPKAGKQRYCNSQCGNRIRHQKYRASLKQSPVGG